MNDAILRARQLIELRRFDMAQSELRRALSEHGENAEVHRLMALCLLEEERYEPAEAAARNAVGLAPDDALAHLTLAQVLLGRRKFALAEVAAEQSLEIEPHNPDAYYLLAFALSTREDWPGMLAASENGLELDPEHEGCNNMRAQALIKLGRRGDAGATLAATLARNPLDAMTHASMGWTKLEAGDHKQAFEHFREALAIDPEMDWAKLGIIEALKSKNFIYRWLLYYFFWAARLSPSWRWGLIIGGLIAQRVLAQVAESNPALAPFCLPLVFLYGIFALLTWLGYPLFNFLLLTDRFGRMTLSTDDRVGAVSVVALIVVGIALVVTAIGLSGGDENAFLLLDSGVHTGLIAILVTAALGCQKGWPRQVMFACTAVMLVVAVVPLAIWCAVALWPVLDGPVLALVYQGTDRVFIPALIGAQFLAMWLMQQVPER